MSKDEILEQYINNVYLGSGAYGIADAAWVYFTKVPNQLNLEEIYYQKQPIEIKPAPSDEVINKPLGNLFGARSGDKGGCANIGVWAKSENAFSFLHEFLTVKKLKELMPDVAQFEIDRYELPNILSLNFYIHGILQDGVSSNTRKDGQAKSLGEYLRAKYIDIPKSLLEELS